MLRLVWVGETQPGVERGLDLVAWGGRRQMDAGSVWAPTSCCWGATRFRSLLTAAARLPCALQVREAAQPFIDWLEQDTESESEEDDE